jgi:Transposase zinc-ribbon domain
MDDPMRPISLKAISNQQRQHNGRSIRQELFGRCRAAADQMGDEIAGFAIVVWDQNGEMRTSYNTARGPIGPALVPTLVSDALRDEEAAHTFIESILWPDGAECPHGGVREASCIPCPHLAASLL